MSKLTLRQTLPAGSVYAEIIEPATGRALLFISFNNRYVIGLKAPGGETIASGAGSTNIVVAYRALLFVKRALATSVPAPASDGLLDRCIQAGTLLGTSVHQAKEALGPTFWYIGWNTVTYIGDLRVRDMPREVRTIALR